MSKNIILRDLYTKNIMNGGDEKFAWWKLILMVHEVATEHK